MSKPKGKKSKGKKASRSIIVARQTVYITIDAVTPNELGLGLDEHDQSLKVKSIRPNSEGYKHFKYDDVILALNGTTIETKHQLKVQMEKANSDTKIYEFKVERVIVPALAIKKRELKPGKKSKSQETKSDPSLLPDVEFLAFEIQNTPQNTGIQVTMVPMKSNIGCCTEINYIDEASPFADKLNPGDWIIAVNGETIIDEKSFINNFKNEIVTIVVARNKVSTPLRSEKFPAVLASYEAQKSKIIPKGKKGSPRSDGVQENQNEEVAISFIEPPTEIREVMGIEKQKEILKWREENLNSATTEDHDQAMQETLQRAMKQLEAKFQDDRFNI